METTSTYLAAQAGRPGKLINRPGNTIVRNNPILIKNKGSDFTRGALRDSLLSGV